jgi:hypothetical protein
MNLYEKRIVRQVGYLQEMNRDAWSTKYMGRITFTRPNKTVKYKLIEVMYYTVNVTFKFSNQDFMIRQKQLRDFMLPLRSA